MKDEIVSILSEKIDKNLVKDLVNSYHDVKDTYIKGDNETALSKSGKFVENVFRVLRFIKSNQVLKEIKPQEFNKISEDLKNADGSKIRESIRILIPRIAMYMIYEPRSKLGAVHVKEINPDFIDGKLTIGACDWIMAEFLRVYHTRDSETVYNLIQNVVKDYIPIIQKIGDEKFVNTNVECSDEILIRLSDVLDDGLTRKDLGESMKNHFGQSAITKALQKLVKDRDIFLTKTGKYVISDPAREKIASKIIELSRRE
ncbi:MAG: hypothetical protein KGI19_08900 [Thaumarchaeota archaeon]|nr:hypothetical protein [Nitrososphaerota archaeon]